MPYQEDDKVIAVTADNRHRPATILWRAGKGAYMVEIDGTGERGVFDLEHLELDMVGGA